MAPDPAAAARLSSSLNRPGLHSRAAVMAFQRSAGNGAVARAIQDARAKGEAGVAQAGSVRADTLQRDLGLEFQTGWQAFHEEPPFAGKPGYQVAYPKEQTIFGGRNSPRGWSMETDGTDIEFVIEPPFAETAAGMVRLNTVMHDLQTFTGILSGFRNTARLTPATHAPIFGINDPKAVIAPNGDVMRAQPQATVGISLDRIEALFEEMARGGAAGDLASSQGTNYFAHVGGLAAQGASALPAVNGAAASHELRGMATMLIQYLRQGANAGRRAYAKDIAYAMARTDFAKMFSSIPEAAYFQANQATWVNYILTAAGMAGTENNRLIEQQIMDGQDSQTMSANQLAALPRLPLTRGDWLSDMALNAPVDRLTQAATLGQGPYTDVKGGNRLRAMGLLGQTTDAVGPGNAAEGIILELRQMKKQIPAADWHQVARSLLTYVTALNSWNRGGGAAPTYQRQ